jgi:Amt family ammonium transporter
MCGIIKDMFKIDDTLDVFAVHGVGGIFGILMAPLLAINALEGGQGLMTQIIALIAVGAFTLIVTVAIAVLCKGIFGLRVNEEDEIEGLDYTAHGERAYDMAS